MKNKFTLLMLVMSVFCISVFGQDAEKITSGFVTNKIGDNWFMTVQGGGIWNGGSHWTKEMQDMYGYKMSPKANFSGLGSITFGKWINPNVGFGIGLDAIGIQNKDLGKTNCSFYPHADLYWDWTNQFGGYRPDRMYHAIPYIHFGGMFDKVLGKEITAGIGFLNQFCVNDRWAINLDLRGTFVRGEQLGYIAGVGGTLDLQFGFTYRLDSKGWTTKQPCPEVKDNSSELEALQNSYDKLAARNTELEQQNRKLQKDYEELKNKPVVAEPAKPMAVNPAPVQEKVSTPMTKDRINQRLADFAQQFNFDSNSDSTALSPEANQLINDLKQYLDTHKGEYTGIRITGHTDNFGSAKNNMTVGMRRAQYVKNILIQKGIDASLIQVESKGMTEPIADNSTPEGMAKNRRVEVVIF